MIRKVILGLTLAALLVALLGCEGGTSGSVTGSRNSSSSGMRGGSGKGSYKKLSGTYSQDIETVGTGQTVQAEVSVSVDKGPVRVYLKAPGGTETSAEARPGSPARLSGQAEVSFEVFRIYFQALEGAAEGVSYTVEYTYP